MNLLYNSTNATQQNNMHSQLYDINTRHDYAIHVLYGAPTVAVLWLKRFGTLKVHQNKYGWLNLLNAVDSKEVLVGTEIRGAGGRGRGRLCIVIIIIIIEDNFCIALFSGVHKLTAL